MIKTWMIVLTVFFANCGFANVQYEYDADTAKNIKSIYWLTKTEDKAIVYARFEAFYSLRDLIDQTILSGNISSAAEVNLDNTDKLLLMMPGLNTDLEMLLTDKYLIFNGKNYNLDNKLINKIKTMNDYRITKGDLISPGTLLLARKNFGGNG